MSRFEQRNEENAKKLAEKIAKKAEMAANGTEPEKKKGHGGGAKKKQANKLLVDRYGLDSTRAFAEDVIVIMFSRVRLVFR